MITRFARWIVPAILLLLAARVAMAATGSFTLLPPPTLSAQVGVRYSSSLQAVNALGPVRYWVHVFYVFPFFYFELPPGLYLNESTGLISGTPITAGSYHVWVDAYDGTSLNVIDFTITVSPALALGSLSISTAQVGVSYSATIQASGGIAPYTYAIAAGALPGGLDFNPKTATSGPMTISGTPTAAGTFNFTVAASDAAAPLPSDPGSSPGGADNRAAARPRGLAQSGNHAADVSNAFSITVAPGAPGAAGAPTSPWTLAMVMAGLAGAGFWRLRPMRRA